MDSNFIDWESAYEEAGLWPVAVELADGDVVYILWYQTRSEMSRVVISGGRAVLRCDLESVSQFLGDSDGFGIGEPGWEAARRLYEIVSDVRPEEATVPRRLIGQSLEWLRIMPAQPTTDQVEELLGCLDFLGEWPYTLRAAGSVGRPWPAVLDGATSILAEAVVWGSITPYAAFQRVYCLGVWPVLERLVSELLNHTVSVSADRSAA